MQLTVPSGSRWPHQGTVDRLPPAVFPLCRYSITRRDRRAAFHGGCSLPPDGGYAPRAHHTSSPCGAPLSRSPASTSTTPSGLGTGRSYGWLRSTRVACRVATALTG